MRTKRIVRLFGLCDCLIALLALSGCWTVRETPPPNVAVAKVPEGKNLTVQIAGFDATVTTYEAAYGYTTVSGFEPYYDYRGRYRGSAYGTTTYSTTEYIPHTESTPVYRDRATDALERAGCVVQAKDPRYRIEVRFDGPSGLDKRTEPDAGRHPPRVRAEGGRTLACRDERCDVRRA